MVGGGGVVPFVSIRTNLVVYPSNGVFGSNQAGG